MLVSGRAVARRVCDHEYQLAAGVGALQQSRGPTPCRRVGGMWHVQLNTVNHQNKAERNCNKNQGPHLGSRYIYIYNMISTNGYIVGLRPGGLGLVTLTRTKKRVLGFRDTSTCGSFLKNRGTPISHPKCWSFWVGKPMVVGETHHFWETPI